MTIPEWTDAWCALEVTSEGWQGDPVRVFLRKKGGDTTEWPADLRIREFPQANDD